MSDNVLDEMMKAYAAVKIQKQHILNQNGANMANIHALDIAQKLGISTDEANKRLGITPFPSPTSNTNTRVETNKTSPWATAAIVLASVVGGAGATALAGKYFADDKEAPAPIVSEPVEPTFGAVDIDVS